MWVFFSSLFILSAMDGIGERPGIRVPFQALKYAFTYDDGANWFLQWMIGAHRRAASQCCECSEEVGIQLWCHCLQQQWPGEKGWNSQVRNTVELHGRGNGHNSHARNNWKKNPQNIQLTSDLNENYKDHGKKALNIQETCMGILKIFLPSSSLQIWALNYLNMLISLRCYFFLISPFSVCFFHFFREPRK